MKGMFSNEQALEEALVKRIPSFMNFMSCVPEHPGDLLFGTSIVYPGTVGGEYFMTKGHFHTILETAEVYYCLQGKGYMLMENPEGEWAAEEMVPGRAVYVPGRWAHRSINTGDGPLITFFVFRADAGHDYGTIETRASASWCGRWKFKIVDNPKWKE